jgi:hypothetical protein
MTVSAYSAAHDGNTACAARGATLDLGQTLGPRRSLPWYVLIGAGTTD